MPVFNKFCLNTILVNSNRDQFTRDGDLITRILNADEKALELLYHLYYHRLFRFIARITRSQDNISEIINDVMFVVWNKASTYDRQCQPSTWIFGIAYNIARRTYASESKNIEQSFTDLDHDIDALEDAYSSLQKLEINNWLESALEMLSLDHRTVIELTYFEGLHYSEIALLMECPENTVKTRMHYARQKLASILKNTV